MRQPAVTREAVGQAVDECKRLGHALFLERYGYRSGRDYFLVVDGQDYDARAILGVAYGYQFPERGALRGEEFPGAPKARLGWGEFSGGVKTVEKLLLNLGLKVRRVRDVEKRGT